MEWQDISTAPKDGTEVLIGGDYSHIRGVVLAVWVEKVPNPCFMDEGGDSYFSATHWMPLPPPPGTPEPSPVIADDGPEGVG